MRSMLTIVFEHGETTDGMTGFLDLTENIVMPTLRQVADPAFRVHDVALNVDLPDCFVLAGGERSAVIVEAILGLLEGDPWGQSKGSPCPDCGRYNQQADGSFWCDGECPASTDFVE